MTATKSWAYIAESGFERITAWTVRQERKEYGGAPLGKTYWSTHKPGRRKPVKHVQKGKTTFFAYINGTERNGTDGGESLTHRLFKEAIADLSGTRLKLQHFGEHDITITHGETEKEILTANGPYYADVYLRFTSTTNLGLRWSGELYVEVNHTHAVPPYKQEDLRQAHLPVMEVDVPGIFEYPFEDEYTSDPLEATHVSKIKTILQKGFLAGRIISDRKSPQYLEQEIAGLEQKLQEALQEKAENAREREEVLRRLKRAIERESSLESVINELAQQKERAEAVANDFWSKLATEREHTRTLSQSLSETRQVIETQQKKIRFGTLIGWGLGTLTACLGVLVLYQRFIALAPDEPTQAAFTSQPVQAMVPHVNAGKAQKGSSRTASRQN